MEDDPAYRIEVSRRADAPWEASEQRIRQAIEHVLRRHQRREATVSVALVNDPHIAELNECYLGHQGPTDVLSFDLSEEGAARLEGQIVISLDTAAREAGRRGHAAEAEVLLYCVHGMLHLLGYGDAEPEQAARMHRREDELLSELGVGVVYGTADE